MILRVTILWLFLLQNTAYNQENLIPNPTFSEVYDFVECISAHWVSPPLELVLKHWSARKKSANLIQMKCRELFPNEPFSYKDSVHIIHRFFFQNASHCCAKDFSQVKLKQPLSPDKNYYLEYYTWLSRPISHLGILFTDTLIKDSQREPPWPEPIITEPHLEVEDKITITGEWTRINHCFSVDQPYDVMIVGTFRDNDYMIERFPEFANYSAIITRYDAFMLIEVEDQLELKIEEQRDTICVGDCITLSTNHSRIPGLFEWQLPGSDIGSSTDSVVTVCYPEAGEFDVGIWLEHCFGDYEELWERAVVVLDHPERDSDEVVNVQVLLGESVQLSSCLPDEPWPIRWNPHPLLECTDCSEPLYYGLESDTVHAILAPDLQCRDSCTYFIEVIQPASAVFSADFEAICVGDCFTIDNNSIHHTEPIRLFAEGEWQTYPMDVERIEFCPAESGDQELIFVVANELSSDTFSFNFNVLPQPERIPVPTQFETEYGESVLLEAGFEANEFLWEAEFPDHLEMDCIDCPSTEVITYLSSDVELIASNEFCTGRMTYTIHVNRQEALIYLPNAFSPNDDGINDLFGAKGLYFTPISLKVYNRYGGLLFEGRGPNHHWDGTAGGQKVNPGAYLFTFEYENLYGERNIVSGEILVME